MFGSSSALRLGRAGVLLASFAMAAWLTGCAGTQVVGVLPVQSTGSDGSDDGSTDENQGDYPIETPRNAPPGGSWTGTITITATIAVDESTSGDNDLPPQNTYYETYTRDRVHDLDVNDTYTLTADDPESLAYGISGVTFTGPAESSGSTTVSDIYHWNKNNSGCTWKEEDGHEMSGSWSGHGQMNGSLEFQEDGSYLVYLQLSPSAEAPALPTHDWLANSDISANCVEVEPGYDLHDEGGPLFAWAVDNYGDLATDGTHVVIDGSIAPNVTSVEGSKSWEIGDQMPELNLDLDIDPIEVTITWSFQHTGPITLPHD